MNWCPSRSSYIKCRKAKKSPSYKSRTWHSLFRFLLIIYYMIINNIIIFSNTVYQYLLKHSSLGTIWKFWHRHWRRHRYCKKFILPSEVFIFAIRSYLWSETSVVKSYSSTLAVFSGRFSCCLEQLFCREHIRACFWRKELHSRRYLRSFKTC